MLIRSLSWSLRVTRAIVLMALEVAALSAHAAPQVDTRPTLPQLILAAQRDNKELLAARYVVDIGRARLVQAGLLPNPRVNVSGASGIAFGNSAAYGVAAGITQDFPMTGRILRQQDVARVDVALAQAEVADAERRLAGEVASGVYRVLIVERQISSIDGLVAVDERLAKVTRSRYRAAEVSELDVNIVALDLRRLGQERARLQAQRETLRIALNLSLGRAPASALNLSAIPLIFDPPDALVEPSAVLARRPDYAIAALQVDRADAELALAKAKRWDDWNIGVGIQQDRQSVDGAPRQSNDRALNLTLTIPLSLSSRSRGLMAVAVIGVDEQRSRRVAVQLAIENQVAAAHAAVTSSHALLAGYRTNLLPVAERNVALAQQGYGRGLITLGEVVQAQRQLSELQSAYLATFDQYLQDHVRLNVAVGDYPLLDRTNNANASPQEEISRKRLEALQ